MNLIYAKMLIFVFLLSAGAYQLARGISFLRSRRESNLWGWIRVALGSFILLIPIPLYLFLSGTLTE